MVVDVDMAMVYILGQDDIVAEVDLDLFLQIVQDSHRG